MQNIARDLKEMRHKEDPRGFYHEASTSTSPCVEQSATHPSLHHSTMPSFLSEEREEETLGDYFVEYESQSRRFKEHLRFQ